jgi:hypothetical protein
MEMLDQGRRSRGHIEIVIEHQLRRDPIDQLDMAAVVAQADPQLIALLAMVGQFFGLEKLVRQGRFAQVQYEVHGVIAANEAIGHGNIPFAGSTVRRGNARTVPGSK